MSIKKRPAAVSRDAEIEAFGAAAETPTPSVEPAPQAPTKPGTSAQTKAILLRLTPEQHALLAEVAAGDGRSMNAMILRILMPELQRRQAQPPTP